MSDAIILTSYSVAAVAYLLLLAMLAVSWRGRLEGGLLLFAVGGMVMWSGVNAWQLAYRSIPMPLIWSLEILHLLLWLMFLIRLVPPQIRRQIAWRYVLLGCYGIAVVSFLYGWASPMLQGWRPGFLLPELPLIGQLVLSLAGMVTLEQLYRNTRPDMRWYIKFLCFGLGGLFAYEFYMYADALLFKQLDARLWAARGFVSAMLVPLLAVTAARNPDWSLNAFISRDFVFHTTVVLGAGLYLLLMATAGYYVRLYGGQWGEVLQVTLLAGGALILLVVLFSGQARARLWVFLNKHFFNYRYDYRKEWLRITHELSQPDSPVPLGERVIKALADLVESPSGVLWTRNDSGRYLLKAQWGNPSSDLSWMSDGDPLVAFLQRTGWIVDLQELKEIPEKYIDLALPAWLESSEDAWLVIPLFHGEVLWAVVLLNRPRASFDCNWEVFDVLKTAGCQAASFLVVEETASRLIEARQFEGFNRLSAFVVHDLKNIVAQLSLVVRNADKHVNNPEFVRDAMNTVDHAVAKMGRLLAQLKNIGSEQNNKLIVLRKLLQEVISARAGQLPRPRFVCRVDDQVALMAQPDRLASAFEHIIQNAQEAAGKQGWVKVTLSSTVSQAIVEVEDNGPGMDDAFVRERLFKPFETTKGLSGMGIGAYESREYVRALGGDLTVESRLGEGTCFRFLLPLVTREERTCQSTGVSV